MNIACPACGATNRVPDERAGEHPVCGRCGTAIAAPQAFALSDEALPKYPEATEQPVVVDFWADWCGPCRAMAPNFAATAARMPGVRFAKVDADEAPRAMGRYGIRGIPTLILFDRGREVARRSGAMPASELERWLREQLETA